MIPEPLHPAVVHFPMALAALVPLVMLVAIVAIRVGFLPARSWALVALLQALLAGSAWIAVVTGEHEEGVLEGIVAGGRIAPHEESAEQFTWLALVVLALSLAGFLPTGWGTAGRIATLVAGLVLLGLGVRVGHTGGELVYRDGAAGAYVSRVPPATSD